MSGSRRPQTHPTKNPDQQLHGAYRLYSIVCMFAALKLVGYSKCKELRYYRGCGEPGSPTVFRAYGAWRVVQVQKHDTNRSPSGKTNPRLQVNDGLQWSQRTHIVLPAGLGSCLETTFTLQSNSKTGSFQVCLIISKSCYGNCGRCNNRRASDTASNIAKDRS